MTQVTTQEKPKSFASVMQSPAIKARFEELLRDKDKAALFMSSLISVVNGNTNLSQAEPQSIILSAAMAASLDLPINPSLGFAYIIPYKKNFKDANGQWQSKQIAQFQPGYKAFIQLAKRSGQYLKINAVEVRANQLKKANHLTEEFEFDFENHHDGEVIGFVAYFKELNGFEKTIYWNVQKMIAHAEKYSKSYNDPNGLWKTNFVAMGKKTLLKEALSKYGTLTVHMANAMKADENEIKDVKNNGDIDIETENVAHTEVSSETQQGETSNANVDAKNNATVNVPSVDQL